ncbi:MAG: helix-turn-helix transcriptional regulator [Clostridiales bacterium]|nr:helix-turn-helix transcriptional regulator [Clostridiales bacterium]
MREIFVKRFAEALEKSGMTQKQLAAKISVSEQAVSDYKKGDIVPSLDTFYLICSALDVSADFLLGFSEI